MKHTGPKSNTTHAMVEAEKSHQKGFDIPEGYDALKGIDKKRWKLLCMSRDQWTATELMMLYEIVIGYRELDAAREAAEGEPIMVEKLNGDKIANPIWHEIRQREKSIRDGLRQVGLQVTQERANKGNGTGKKASNSKSDEPERKVVSLIG